MFVVRIFCYGGLAYVAAGFGTLIILSAAGVCPVLNEGGISCNTPFYTELGKFSMTVMLLSVFTGLPLLIAMGGVVFLIVDLARLLRKRQPQELQQPQSSPSIVETSLTKPIPPKPSLPKKSFLANAPLAVKIVLYAIGLFIAAGIITGIVQGIMGKK